LRVFTSTFLILCKQGLLIRYRDTHFFAVLTNQNLNHVGYTSGVSEGRFPDGLLHDRVYP